MIPKFMALCLIATLMMTSCIATRSTVRMNKVEVGMTKKDITRLLGTPIFRNGDADGEEWGYRKQVGEVAGPEEVIFVVTFNGEGKVVAYETVKEYI